MRPADTRRRVSRKELLSSAADPEQLDEIIDTFAAYRLISLDHDRATRASTVEVAHEAILREWDRLCGWLEESLVDLGLHRQLVRVTQEWIESGNDPSFLLRGARLDGFQNWAGETSLVLSGDEREYLQTSIGQRELRAAAERERQEQEALLERQSNRRLKALLAVMAVALLVAIGLATAAFFFARQAETQRRLATARELAAAAAANLDVDPERSLLLALEAATVTFAEDGIVLPEVEEILRQASEADQIELTILDSGMLAYSPDGEMLAIGSEDGRLTLWNAQTGELIRELPGHGQQLVSTVVFSQDGELLVSGGFDSLIKIWHIASGRLLGELHTFDRVNTFALSPDGGRVAVALREKDVQVWNIIPLLEGHTEGIIQSSTTESDSPRLLNPAPAARDAPGGYRRRLQPGWRASGRHPAHFENFGLGSALWRSIF